MAKYSTGGGAGPGAGGSCELCGQSSEDLQKASVAGAELELCPDCAPHDETAGPGDNGDDGSRDEGERRREAARNAAKVSDAASNDPDYWVDQGPNYDEDQLPYLVSNYGERVVAARQEAGYQRDELAEEIGVEENELLAVEQGRATQAGVGGSVIRGLEATLDVDLIEE